MIFQFKSLKSAAVTANNNATTGTPTGAANDEESDVMTTMEKLEAEAKDVSPSDAFQVLCHCSACVHLSRMGETFQTLRRESILTSQMKEV